MKKVLKIILTILFVGILLAYFIMYYACPEFLKQLTENVQNFLNKPLPIVGCSVGIACFTIYQIFSHTSFGKKLLNSLNKKVDDTLAKCEEMEKIAKEYYNNAQTVYGDTKAVLGEYRKELNKITNDIVEVAKLSPNAKIKAFGEKLELEYSQENEKLNELTNKIGLGIEKSDDKYNDILLRFKELEEKFARLTENEKE